MDELLRRQRSPEQISGRPRRTGQLSISHETVYRHVWLVGELKDRAAVPLGRGAASLMRRHAGRVETATADNGTESHPYQEVEGLTGATFYCARPHHSWESRSNENANGLIRRYLPKGASLAGLSRHRCNAIARKLNTRPRKRLGFRTPPECFDES